MIGAAHCETVQQPSNSKDLRRGLKVLLTRGQPNEAACLISFAEISHGGAGV